MIKTVQNIVFFWFIALILVSCVTQKACDRRFPPIIKTETVIRDTTIVTETTRFDTIHVIHESHDTVFFHDVETQIKIKYVNLPGDSIFIQAECPPDTVIVTKEIVTNNIEERPKRLIDSNGFAWIGALFILGLLLIAAGYFIKQLKR
jgi:hypothetical protein|tara:strand:- start:4223 stop:4666 length:444 start_codon:yes stop_codon:yes gene_type:complete